MRYRRIEREIIEAFRPGIDSSPEWFSLPTPVSKLSNCYVIRVRGTKGWTFMPVPTFESIYEPCIELEVY